MKRLSVMIVEGKNQSVFIEEEGRKVNAREGRVYKNRSYMSFDMIHIPSDRAPKLLYQTQMTAIDTNGKVVDKHRDYVDSGDYAWMTPQIDTLFDNYRDKKRRILRR